MNEQSRYKQDNTRTRQSITVKSHIFNIRGDNDKTKQTPIRISSMVRRSLKKKTSTLGEIVSLNYIKSKQESTPATVETGGFLTELGAQVEMQRGFIHDYAVRLEELSPTLFERSLEYEHERVSVTFRAIWRPVLALEAWAGQTDAQRVALWHAISDVQGENRDLWL
ncbi:hypothetical protein Tco_0921170 [Tanacetum coccineum]